MTERRPNPMPSSPPLDFGIPETRAGDRVVTTQPTTLATTLRDAWLSRRPVCVQLTDCAVPMVVGRVSQVSVTGTWATIDGWHVPLERVREVREPDRVDTGDYAHLMHDLRMRADQREESA